MTLKSQVRAEKLQPAVIERLKKVLQNNELAHAYLLVGPSGAGKMAIATWLALRLFCEHPQNNEPDLSCAECQRILSHNHPDVVVAAPENRQIKVDEIRRLKTEFSKSAMEGNKKLFLIRDADKMTTNAANSLLKFIEEPSSGIYIVMMTTNKSAILPTIQSRTQIIELQPLRRSALLQVLTEQEIPTSQQQIAIGLTDSVTDIKTWCEDGWFGNVIAAVIHWYQDTAKADMLGFVDIQTQLMKLATDRQRQQIILDLITLVWRDTLMVANGVTAEQRLHFNNIKSQLQGIVAKYSTAQLLKASELTLETRHMLEQNINFQNVVEQLTIRLVKTLRTR